MSDSPGKYVNHIYGEKEAGGTSIMYMAAVPFEKLGFNIDVETETYPDETWEFLSRIPLEIVGITAVLGGVYFWRKRRLDKISIKS